MLEGSLGLLGSIMANLSIFPAVMAIELPLYLLVLTGMVRHALTASRPAATAGNAPFRPSGLPGVSCIITCYSEGDAVIKTIDCLVQQDYAGSIEVIAVVDGADRNRETLAAARRSARLWAASRRRRVKVIPKWQRGGRVSSLNTGLALARGAIVMALDGDTSFDDDMVSRAVSRMQDPRVIALTGTLRVRNGSETLWTRLQALEYLIGLVGTRTGLSSFNVTNNVSGAFGVFRRDILQRLGGWECGTAEDLDLTLRLQRHTGRRPGCIIAFEPGAIGHTDAPASLRDLLMQRLRWDGDLFYIYVRKHWRAFSPRILGWRRLLATTWYGLLHQLVLPFVIALYALWMTWHEGGMAVVLTLGLIYVLYLAIAAVMAAASILLISERRARDCRLLPLLLVFPVYRGVMRLWSVVAILAEIVLTQHRDSSMAPWWVLRRSVYR